VAPGEDSSCADNKGFRHPEELPGICLNDYRLLYNIFNIQQMARWLKMQTTVTVSGKTRRKSIWKEMIKTSLEK